MSGRLFARSTVTVCAAMLQVFGAGSFLWPILALIAGLVLLIRGVQLYVRQRQLPGIPQFTIAGISQGRATVSGRATGPYNLRSPITGAPCFYYRAIAWIPTVRTRDQWIKAAEESFYTPFFLDDGSGQLLVDPRAAEVDVPHSLQHEFDDSIFANEEAIPDYVRGFIVRNGVPCDGKIKIQEFCIQPGDELHIVGTVAENTGTSIAAHDRAESHKNAYSVNLGTLSMELDKAIQMATASTPLESSSSAAVDVIRLASEPAPENSAHMSQQQKIAAALHKAGIQDPAAWAAAGVATEDESQNFQIESSPHKSCQRVPKAANSSSAPGSFELSPALVLAKGATDSPFTITFQEPNGLTQPARWQSVLLLITAPLMTLLALYLLLSRLALLYML